MVELSVKPVVSGATVGGSPKETVEVVVVTEDVIGKLADVITVEPAKTVKDLAGVVKESND